MDNRTFKSLETPAHYFGCHASIALVALLLPVASFLSFILMPDQTLSAILIVISAIALSGAIFKVGSYLGSLDPFWVEGGFRHLTQEKDYLDV